MIIKNEKELKIESLEVPKEVKEKYPTINVRLLHITQLEPQYESVKKISMPVWKWRETWRLECTAKLHSVMTYSKNPEVELLLAGVDGCLSSIYGEIKRTLQKHIDISCVCGKKIDKGN